MPFTETVVHQLGQWNVFELKVLPQKVQMFGTHCDMHRNCSALRFRAGYVGWVAPPFNALAHRHIGETRWLTLGNGHGVDGRIEGLPRDRRGIQGEGGRCTTRSRFEHRKRIDRVIWS